MLKELQSGDTELFRDLLKVFADAFDEEEEYLSAQPKSSYLEALLKREDIIVLIASDEDKVVGGLIAYIYDKFEQERREVYVYDLAVAASYRRRGIARSMLEKIKVIAKREGAYIVSIAADKGDVPPNNLYASMAKGESEEAIYYEIRV